MNQCFHMEGGGAATHELKSVSGGGGSNESSIAGGASLFLQDPAATASSPCWIESATGTAVQNQSGSSASCRQATPTISTYLHHSYTAYRGRLQRKVRHAQRAMEKARASVRGGCSNSWVFCLLLLLAKLTIVGRGIVAGICPLPPNKLPSCQWHLLRGAHGTEEYISKGSVECSRRHLFAVVNLHTQSMH